MHHLSFDLFLLDLHRQRTAGLEKQLKENILIGAARQNMVGIEFKLLGQSFFVFRCLLGIPDLKAA